MSRSLLRSTSRFAGWVGGVLTAPNRFFMAKFPIPRCKLKGEDNTEHSRFVGRSQHQLLQQSTTPSSHGKRLSRGCTTCCSLRGEDCKNTKACSKETGANNQSIAECRDTVCLRKGLGSLVELGTPAGLDPPRTLALSRAVAMPTQQGAPRPFGLRVEDSESVRSGTPGASLSPALALQDLEVPYKNLSCCDTAY